MEESRSNKKAIIIVIILLTIFIVAGVISYSNRSKYFQVSFDTNGGEYLETIKVKEGQTIGSIDEPVRKGYDFLYWKIDGKKVTSNYKVTKNVKLVAVWKKKDATDTEEFIVKFDSDGGSSVASQKVESGNKVKRPTPPTKSGYLFKEWTLDGTTYDFESKVEKDITLKATWEKEEKKDETPATQTTPSTDNKPTSTEQKPPTATAVTVYTITFDSNGGSSVATQNVEGNQLVVKPQDPTKDGYLFTGWTLNGASYDFSSKVTSNFTLVATWKDNSSYTIGIAAVDPYSPDRYLTVYKNGTAVSISKLMYNDGTAVMGSISGSTMTVSSADIAGETTFKVQLASGEVVTAKVN